MLRRKHDERKKTSARDVAYIGMTAAVLAVLAQLALPMPSGTLLTLQTLAVALAGFLLGPRRGVAAVGVYLLLGAVGLPVFAAFRGGWGVLMGLTGGFLWGFVPLAAACGYSRRLKRAGAIALALAGLLLCHLIGLLWAAYLSASGLLPAFVLFCAPYLPKDILCLLAARYLAGKLTRQLPGLAEK